ncbi:hypothetical protein R3P38DRAFT_3234332 [Favolaschia claudopus]|uniref:Uncharacterized protein n=2 Tax=Favolaschia claudopus TaxID=2862362 RepID=A0AAV9ZHQ0_9AGAR
MTTWAATKRVLTDHERFKEIFGKQFQLTPPALLVRLNDGDVPWKATNSITEGADKVSDKIDALTRRFKQVEHDMGVRIDSTHALIGQVQKSTARLADNVSHLANAQRSTNLAVSSMQQEISISRQLVAAESSLRLITMLGATEEEKQQARENLEVVKMEKMKLTQRISNLQGTLLAIPPPPPRPPPGLPSTPTRAPQQNSSGGRLSHSPTPSPKRRRISNETNTTAPRIVPDGEDDIEMSNQDNTMPVVRSSCVVQATPLMATRFCTPADGMMYKNMTHRYTRGPDGTRGVAERVAFLVDRRRMYQKCLRRTRRYFFLDSFLFLASLVNLANATGPTSTFSIYSFNANGLVHSVKMHHISSAISHRKPHVFVLNESKTNSQTAKNLPNGDYQIHEEPGVKTTNHHLYKWGVVLGVRKDIQVVQRLTNLHAALRGRIVVVDVALPQSGNTAHIHRVFGVYAPWDPGTADTRDFCPLCSSYEDFLRWNGQLVVKMQEISTLPFSKLFAAMICDPEKNGGSIIDRVATSTDTLLDAEIFVANENHDFIPNTNHRAIIARLVIRPPGGGFTIFSHVPATSAKPRISKLEPHRHDKFRKMFDERAEADCLQNIEVVDEESPSFGSMKEAYGRMSRFRKRDEFVTNTKIQKALADVRAYGGALRILRGDADFCPSKESQSLALKIRRQHSDDENGLPLLKVANLLKRNAYKRLFQERAMEIKARTALRDKRQIMGALYGGSTKRLVKMAEFVPMPLVITEPGSEQLIGEPTAVKEALNGLARSARERVSADPFLWPQPAELKDLRAVLRKGNARPAPGPDGWEKWVVKNLSDDSLGLVLQLVNYITRSPDRLDELARRLPIQIIANCPITWLNFLLTPYSSKKGLIPDTQVATQQDVRTRDLMSYLASVKCWSTRHKVPVYAIKRDQMKGFDYLSPEGMYDAVRAYGLPQQIIDIDEASQTSVRCFIRTAHGLTESITISGVNKQGAPMSLNDLLANNPAALIITSSTSGKADPHLLDDHLQLLVAMTEATDDSYLFAKTLHSLRRSTLEMERFQYAYGWMTQWSKTVAYALQVPGDLPSKVSFDSVTIQQGVDPMLVTKHDVPLIRDELDFLRAKVDNPAARFEELKAFKDKVPMYCLPLSRASFFAAYQTSEEMDRRIMRKVHDELGMPFTPNTLIMGLPLKLHGLEFPSIARINAGIAIDGLARDLNHHIHAYRTMARITLLADWTCSIDDCANPLDGAGLQRDFSHHAGRIPYGWIVAQKIMGSKDINLSLRRTERTEILSGEVSLSHCVALHNCRTPLPTGSPKLIDGHGLRSLRAKSIRTVNDIGEWVVTHAGYAFQLRSRPSVGKWSEAAKDNWNRITVFLSRMSVNSLFDGTEDLLLQRSERRTMAECTLRRLANVSKLRPSPTAIESPAWATDGSMIPANAGLLQPKSVTAAITGPITLAVRIEGRNIAAMQGELMALVAGLLFAESSPDPPPIYTDYLNAVNMVTDKRSKVNQDAKLRRTNARSYYRWILSLVERTEAEVIHIRGHTDALSVPSQMNFEADHYAFCAQKFIDEIPLAPIPTFDMDDFTFFSPGHGWIELGLRLDTTNEC